MESSLDSEDMAAEGGQEPKREPLYFHYDPATVSPEMGGVMDSIKQLAEKLLYHWRELPIVLPESITDASIRDSGRWDGDGDSEKKGWINFKNMFIAPTFEELEEVAKGKAGGLKKLNEKQLNSIWKQGEFEVDSIHFPGQVHRWRLTQLLQKGSIRAQGTLLNDAALSLRLLIITARDRFCSQFFSVSDALRGWGQGLWKLLDIAFGMPSTTAGDLGYKVKQEHMRYLVAELSIKPSSKRELNNFCEYVKEQCRLLRTEKNKTPDLRPPPIPYRYLTPKGQEIDLRLFNKDLMDNCLPILSNILDREAKGWTVQYRQRLVREFRGKGLSNEGLSDRVNEAVMQEYLKRVFSAVITNAELDNLQAGIGELLVAQAKAVLAMRKAVQNLQLKMQKHKQQLVNHLKKEYSVKSRIKSWMNEQLQSFEEEFLTQNLWSAHEEAISICEDQGLNQAIYFLRRDLNFIKERETILRQELSKVKEATRVFTFSTKIWFPQNWVIRRHFRGETEIIQTVITDSAPENVAGEKEMTYTVDKYIERKTSTRHPFWRWWNYLHRAWSWTWNSMFFFGVVIVWCSPVGLRALFSPSPFMPDLKLSQVNGVLYPKPSSQTHTLLSRLRGLWTHVHDSRKKFEETPDTGFLGKSFTRHVNRFWNYVVKGAFGSLLLSVVFPVFCVVISAGSLVLSITSPLWVPLVTLVVEVGFFIIFDWDCPDDHSNKICILLEALIWRILLQGCVQPIAAALFGHICCPLASLAIILFGVLRRGGRGLWDTLMFHAVIKSRGRVPAGDGFVARRIAGPGLASNYFFQILPEQALAAVEARLELDELEAWKMSVLRVIEQPREDYRHCHLPPTRQDAQFVQTHHRCQVSRTCQRMQVTVWYPSGKKTTILTDDTHKRMCMTIARGSNVEKVVADQIRSAKPGAIIEASAKVVKGECQELCQRGSGTVVQDKSYDNLLHFSWEDFHKDLKTQCPSFLALLEAAVCDSHTDTSSNHFRHVMMTAAVSLHGRNREMSVMQYLTAFVLMHGGCTQKNIERLAQLGMCVHPKTVHRKLMSWQANLDAELLALRDSWANGGSTKYQLVGDNWDKNILPSYRTSDRKTVSLHLFNMYAVVDRVKPSPAVGFCKVLDATQLDASQFIPSCDEQDQLMKELTFIFATTVVNNIPKLERCFKAIYPKHLHHTYSATAGVKTVQYPLGLFDCNENLTQELITLLATSLEKYVPMSDGDIVESVFLGGDRLTDERVQGAQNAMRNAPTAKEKLEGFISKTEDFHRLMNFLEAVTKMTYSTKSVNDRGTMHYYRNLLNARNVKGKVKNAYRPYKILYYTVLEGLCLAFFLQHFGIEDLDADIPIPDGFSDMSEEDKIGWLNDICSTILRKWFFDSTQDVFHYLREVITDKDHPENYWLANLDHDTGRVRCHFCDKSYAYVGSLMSHEKKVHNVGIEKPLKKSKGTGGDELHSYILMLFKLLLLHKNLDTAVDMGDIERRVRSAKYELPIYNRTNKVKYCIGSIHLTSLSSGLLPKEQTERFVANRFINLQGGRNNNIALDEFIEMLNRDSKIACSGYKTKESIIRHSKEYPHLTNSIRHFDSLCAVRKSKGFHHLPSFKEDVAKVAKDLIEIDALNPQNQRTLHCKELVTERNPFDKCFHGLSTMVHRHKPSVPFRRLRDRHF